MRLRRPTTLSGRQKRRNFHMFNAGARDEFPCTTQRNEIVLTSFFNIVGFPLARTGFAPQSCRVLKVGFQGRDK